MILDVSPISLFREDFHYRILLRDKQYVKSQITKYAKNSQWTNQTLELNNRC